MTGHASWLRPVAGYTAVAATLPYLILKAAWLSGSAVGFTDPEVAHDTALYTANAVTAGLDGAALVLALTFTHRFGRRAPAWLVLLPIWVGTGLLAPVAVVAPLQMLVPSAADTASDAVVRPWVYAMVYTGFVVEAVALLVAFLLYARQRWSGVLRQRMHGAATGPTRQFLVTGAIGAAALATPAAAAHVAWAVGARLGQSPRAMHLRGPGSTITDAVFALFALAGVVGLLMLVYRRPAGAGLRIPLILAWTGSASLFAWGGFQTITTLSVDVLADGGAGALPNLVGLAKMVAGLVAGLVGAVALAQPAGDNRATDAAPARIVRSPADRPCQAPARPATID